MVCSMYQKQKGFTVLELITAMAIGSLLMGIAVINLNAFANPSNNGASELMGFIKRARAKAMATTHSYTVYASSSNSVAAKFGQNCSTETWTDDPELATTLPNGASLDSTEWEICYSSRGLSADSADITVRDSRATRLVQVVLGGGVRIQ